jgi:hypothetical protein
MEQAVWLAFGVLSLIIGLSIIAQVLSSNRDETRYVGFKEAMEQLKQQCDFVCDGNMDTYLSTEVELSSGLRLYASDTRLCGHLNISDDYDDETKCVLCKCPVTLKADFNLQTDLAKESFKTHQYSCYFLRKENEVQMECKG